MSDDKDAFTDVVELCALLECLGFSVKSLDSSNNNMSQEDDPKVAPKTVVINCQYSGMHVVLESTTVSCSCPSTDPQNSGFWQVSGVTGGKQLEKESGCTVLRGLPKPYRERLSKQLHDMIRCIRAINDLEDASKPLNKSNSLVELASKSASASLVDLGNRSASLVELSKENKSASILEMGTPEKRHYQLKVDTPTRYRSLDTLTKDGQAQLMTGMGDNSNLKKSMCRRQSTYTVCSTCSTPGSVRRRNKTSSPIHTPSSTFLDSLIEAERDAENLRNKLVAVIREYTEDKHDSSISSMLDVSKISVLKGPEKSQFASSPNLSGISSIQDCPTSKLKRFESASTSNLVKPREGMRSKLMRISPHMFKSKDAKEKPQATGRSKLQSLFRPKIVVPVTPVRAQRLNSESSPKVSSATKNKYSHVKSTIPRPTPAGPTPKKD
ncbi:hypothetical protein O0L34_g258 [Tuta absoluta]|nr:hypothetical protein O0L34_g258 [Tuta absoluta]